MRQQGVFPYTKQVLVRYDKNNRATFTRTHACCVLVFLLKPEAYFHRGDFTHSPGYTPLLNKSLIQKVQGGGWTPAKYVRTGKGNKVHWLWRILNWGEQTHDYDLFLQWSRNWSKYDTKEDRSLEKNGLLSLCDKLFSFCFILKSIDLERLLKHARNVVIPRNVEDMRKHTEAWREVLDILGKKYRLPKETISNIFNMSGHYTFTLRGEKGFFSKFPQQKITFFIY